MPRPAWRALVFVLIAAAARTAEAATLEERFEHTYPLQAGGAFALDNVNGDISITPADRPEVRLSAVKHVKAASAARARELLAALEIQVTPRPAEVAVETRFPRHSGGFFDWLAGGGSEMTVTYRVEVPRGAHLRIGSVNSAIQVTGGAAADLKTVNGPIDASGVRGALRAATVNGAITLAGAAGAVHARSVNGAVDVAFAALPAAGAPARISTTNGAVTVHLPRQARASLDARSTNGRVACALPIQRRGQRRHGLAGDLNGGGERIEIATMNGGIEILEARR
jgi:hypothetical protein